MNRISTGVRRGPAINIVVDGQALQAYPGETVAAALLAHGRRVLRYTAKRSAPRGMFCGMGVCYECLMRIDGAAGVRGCMTAVQDGMQVETGSTGDARAR